MNTVSLPDGTKIHFPDDTSEDKMSEVASGLWKQITAKPSKPAEPTPTGPPEVSTLPEQSVQLGGGRPAPPAQSFGAKSVWQNVTTPVVNYPPEAIAQQLRFNPANPAIGMALAALPPKLREDIIKGVSEGVAQNVVDPFLSPLGAGTMLTGGAIPKVAQKAMQIGFGVLGGMGVPGTLKRLGQAKTPGEASKELIGLGAEAGMAVGGVKGLAEGVAAVLPRTRAALKQVSTKPTEPTKPTSGSSVSEAAPESPKVELPPRQASKPGKVSIAEKILLARGVSPEVAKVVAGRAGERLPNEDLEAYRQRLNALHDEFGFKVVNEHLKFSDSLLDAAEQSGEDPARIAEARRQQKVQRQDIQSSNSKIVNTLREQIEKRVELELDKLEQPTKERPENAEREIAETGGVPAEQRVAPERVAEGQVEAGTPQRGGEGAPQAPNAPEGQARDVLAPASELDALQTIRDAGMPLSDQQQARLSELEKAAAPPPVRPEGEPTRVAAAAATTEPSGPGAAVTAAPPAASVSEATTSQGVKQAPPPLPPQAEPQTAPEGGATKGAEAAAVEKWKPEYGSREKWKQALAENESLLKSGVWKSGQPLGESGIEHVKSEIAEYKRMLSEHPEEEPPPENVKSTGYTIYRRTTPSGYRYIVAGPEETGIRYSAKISRWKVVGKNLSREEAFAKQAKLNESGTQPDFVGLGAAAAGEAPIESQLTQLSRNIRAQSISPRTPFMERLKNALNISDSWSRGKDAVTRSVARLTAVKDSLVSAYMNEPPWRNYETSLGQWTGRDQQTALQVRSFQKDINRSIPDKLRQEAITNWIQAGGDEALLRERANASKGRLRQGYELALTLNDAEKTLARNIQSYLESMLDEGVKAGLLKQGVDNYVTQIWKRPNAVTQKMVSDLFGGGMLNPNFKFAKKRIFDSYFEGEQLGFEPKDKSIGRLVAAYDLAFNRALSARTFIKSLKDGTAADDKPIIITSGKTIPVPPGEPVPEAFLIKPNAPPEGAVTADGRPYQPINHWALRDWKWATKGPEGQNVFVQGDLLVHPDHYLHLKRVLGKSLIRKVGVGEAALKVGSFAKQTKLSLSPFHTVQEGIHSLAHRVNPINPPEIDLNVPLQKALVNHGLMIQDPSAYELFAEGSGGGGLVGKIPGLGKLQQLYTEMTFKDYIPRLKMAMAQDAFERNRTAYSKDVASGKITEDQLLALTARESNAAFGEQNYKMMGRSQTFQDFLRLTLLAPDFLEARFRFVGQALKPYGREQRIALGLMGATLWTASRIMNKALDNDYHWDKPFSIISGGKEYRLRTILGDVAHLVGDWRNFWYNRLSPITRTGVEAITSRDDRGIKRSSAEQFVDFLSWFKPIPFQTRPGEGVAQALLASAGAPTRAYSKVQEFYGILDKWKNRQTDPSIRDAYERERQETHATSQYQPLRATLNANDLKGALKEYNKLVAKGVDTRKIVRAMQPKPFMSREHEAMMLNDLTPDERKVYDQAMAERVQTWQRFTDMLQNQ